MIIPHFINKHKKNPHHEFRIPNAPIKYDLINTTGAALKKVRNYNITVPALECVNDCSENTNKPVLTVYIIHITNQPDFMQFFSKCNLERNDLEKVLLNDGKNNTQEVKDIMAIL